MRDIPVEFRDSIIAQGHKYLVDLVAFRLVVLEVAYVDFVESLEGSVVSECSLILGNVFPGGFYCGETVAVYGFNVAFDHGSNGTTVERCAFIGFRTSLFHDLFSQDVDSFDKLLPQGVLWNIIETMEISLFTDRPHHQHTISLLKIRHQGSSNFLSTLIRPNQCVLIHEAVFQIFLWGLPVAELKCEIS